MKEKLIKEIKERMDIIEQSTKENNIIVNSDNVLDWNVKLDIKNKLMFISLSCEDLTDCNHSTWCNPEKFKNTIMFDLDEINEYGIKELLKITYILSLLGI